MGGSQGQGVTPINNEADDPETFAGAAAFIAALDTILDVGRVGSLASGRAHGVTVRSVQMQSYI